MNTFNKKLLALAVVSTLTITACSSDDDSLPTPTPTPDPTPDPVVVEDPVTDVEETPLPEYPETNTLSLQLSQAAVASGDLASAGVTILSDAGSILAPADAFVFDETGLLTLNLNRDQMLDDDLDGELDTPFFVEVQVSMPGFFTAEDLLTVFSFGANEGTLDLIARDDPALAEQGISSESQEVNLETLPLDEESGKVVIESTVPESAVQEVAFAPDVILLDDAGIPLDTADVQIEQASIDVNSEALPIEESETVSNVDEVSEALGIEVTAENADQIAIEPAAFIDIEVTAGGESVSAIGGSEPLSVTTILDPNTLNPQTGNSIQAGEQIPVWSKSQGEAGWTYEETVDIVENDNGQLEATFSTTHLTSFTLGGASVNNWRNCSTGINLIEDNGRFVEPGRIVVSYTENGTQQTDSASFITSPISIIYPSGGSIEAASITFVPDDTTKSFEFVDSSSPTLSLPDACFSSSNYSITETTEVPPPRISVTSPTTAFTTLTEGDGGNVTFDVTVAGVNLTADGVDVTFTPTAGTASAATDFSGATSVVSLTDTNTEGTYSVTIVGDDIAEARTEQFGVTASLTGEATFVDGSQSQNFTVRISDDDTLTIGSVGVSSANESDGQVNFVLNAATDFPDGQTRVFEYLLGASSDTATPNEDYLDNIGGSATRANGPRTVTATSGNNQFTFSIGIENDTDFEGDETFTFNLFNTDDVFIGTGAASTVVTIIDDDPEPVAPATSFTLTDAANSPVTDINMTENTVRNFKITLDTPATETVIVDLDTTGGLTIDGGESATLTFEAGQATRAFTVVAANDRVVEADAEVSLTTSSTLTGGATLNGTLTDDDFNTGILTVTVAPDGSLLQEGSNASVFVNYSLTLRDPLGAVVDAGDAILSGVGSVSVTNALSGTAASDLSASAATTDLAWPESTGAVVIDIANDDVLESTENAVLALTGTASLPARTNFVRAGGTVTTVAAATDSFTLNESLTVRDDDAITVRGTGSDLPASISLDSGSGGDNNGVFEAVNETLSVTTSAQADFAYNVIATVTSDNAAIAALIAQPEQTLVIGAGATTGTVDVTLASSNINDLSLPNNGDSVTGTVTVTLSLDGDSIPEALANSVSLGASTFSFSVTYTNAVTNATGAG